MKIKTKDFEFEGEYPICKKCLGIILPIVTQNYIFGDPKERKGGVELSWKCLNCDTITKVSK